MTAIALLLAAAAVGFALSQWLRLPGIPLLILAGVLVSWLAPPPATLVQDAVVLGVTFLLFVAGLELNPARVGAHRRTALRVGVIQFTVLAGAGMAAALALGFTVQASLYLAVALAASSTLVVVRLLQQRQQLFEPYGRLVIGVLLLQDVGVILMIPVVTRLPDGAAAMAAGLVAALVLLALAYVSLRWIMPWLIRRLADDEEVLLLAVLAVLFGFIGIADALRLPLVAGAFLAGVSLSSFPVSGLVRAKLNSLSDFFLAILFTALGAMLVLPTALELVQALALALLVVVITPPLVTAVAERQGASARSALETGLLLSQTSEFSLVVGLQGLLLGHIDAGVFTIIVLVTVLTMMATPFLSTDRVTWSLLRLHPVRSEPTAPVPHRDHVVLLGCGDNGMPLLETLFSAGRDVVVVDDDPAIVARLQIGEVPCIRGDGSDPEILQRAGVRYARLIISTIRRAADNLPLLDAAGGVPVLVRVFDAKDADAIRRRGGIPILYSEAAAEDFLNWFERFEAATGAPAAEGTGAV